MLGSSALNKSMQKRKGGKNKSRKNFNKSLGVANVFLFYSNHCDVPALPNIDILVDGGDVLVPTLFEIFETLLEGASLPETLRLQKRIFRCMTTEL